MLVWMQLLQVRLQLLRRRKLVVMLLLRTQALLRSLRQRLAWKQQHQRQALTG